MNKKKYNEKSKKYLTWKEKIYPASKPFSCLITVGAAKYIK
jgi:hypothetical protein